MNMSRFRDSALCKKDYVTSVENKRNPNIYSSLVSISMDCFLAT